MFSKKAELDGNAHTAVVLVHIPTDMKCCSARECKKLIQAVVVLVLIL
jgi:hypothetical protein